MELPVFIITHPIRILRPPVAILSQSLLNMHECSNKPLFYRRLTIICVQLANVYGPAEMMLKGGHRTLSLPRSLFRLLEDSIM